MKVIHINLRAIFQIIELAILLLLVFGVFTKNHFLVSFILSFGAILSYRALRLAIQHEIYLKTRKD